MKPFEAYADALLAQYGVPGAAAAASRDGNVVFARGFGTADRERGVPAAPETVFGVASVTKSFTAAAIMRLAGDHRLSVDDPVVEYLPELRVPHGDVAAIRIHHFLTHTPGFPPLPSRWYAFGASARLDAEGAPPPVPVESRPPFATAGDLMTYLAETDWTPLGPPGAYFSYSNEGFALLGEIVARVSGGSYERFVTDEIIRPLGLTRTAFGPRPAALVEGMTTPYIARAPDDAKEIVPAKTWWHSEVWDPAGGICSTVLDLLHYLDLYRGGSGRGVLSEQAIAAMLRPYAPTGPGQAYGYGFAIIPDYWGAPLVEHGGGRRSISAHVACVPSRGTAVTILANLAEVPVRAIAHGLLNVLEGRAPEIAAISYPDYAAPPGRLEDYVGEYRSGEGSLVLARVAGGRLEIEADGERLPARAVGPDAFTVTVRHTELYVRFHRNGGGRAWAVAYGSRVIRRTG